ncbi:DUF2934 domain-containing protein [Ensifer soli]|uniref:DUF2934 domain-containing protein n=1 Tax=Ciceribacter sp. sgz301302 TaxID=3342379 RepID=UPI0035BB906B
MSNERLDWINRRAYQIWEENGRPDGRDQDHWNQALREREELEGAAEQALTVEPADIAGEEMPPASAGPIADDTALAEKPVKPRAPRKPAAPKEPAAPKPRSRAVKPKV